LLGENPTLGIIDWIKYQRARRKFPKTKSLALPLPKSIELQTGSPRIGVVLHLFYVDLAAEIASYLANVPLPFDLLISTDTEKKKMEIVNHPLWKLAAHAEIHVVPNRGRDMAPKLVTFSGKYKNYDLLLFIHSKQSLYNSVLAEWRHVIFSQLLGTRGIVESVLGLFNAFPKLGIVAPSHFEPILFAVNWTSNWQGANRLAKRMGMCIDPKAPMDFPSGSMFWARPQALAPLLGLNLKYEDFEPEANQTDGALGHQLERLFYFACEKAGYSWLKIARSEFHRDKSRIVEVNRIAEIEKECKPKP
jgi:O-antigen biosynthesis protein